MFDPSENSEEETPKKRCASPEVTRKKRQKTDDNCKKSISFTVSAPRKTRRSFGKEQKRGFSTNHLFLGNKKTEATYDAMADYKKEERKLIVSAAVPGTKDEEHELVFEVGIDADFPDREKFGTRCHITQNAAGIHKISFSEYGVFHEYDPNELAEQLDVELDKNGLMPPTTSLAFDASIKEEGNEADDLDFLNQKAIAEEQNVGHNETKFSFLAYNEKPPTPTKNKKKSIFETKLDDEEDVKMKAAPSDEAPTTHKTNVNLDEKLEKDNDVEMEDVVASAEVPAITNTLANIVEYHPVDNTYHFLKKITTCSKNQKRLRKVEIQSKNSLGSWSDPDVTVVVFEKGILVQEKHDSSTYEIIGAESIVQCVMNMRSHEVFLITNAKDLMSWHLFTKKFELIGRNCEFLKESWDADANKTVIVASFQNGTHMIFENINNFTEKSVFCPTDGNVVDVSLAKTKACFLMQNNHMICVDMDKDAVVMDIALPFQGLNVLSKEKSVMIFGETNIMLVDLETNSAMHYKFRMQILDFGLVPHSGDTFVIFGNKRDDFHLASFDVQFPKQWKSILIHDYLKNSKISFHARRGVILHSDYGIFEFRFDRFSF